MKNSATFFQKTTLLLTFCLLAGTGTFLSGHEKEEKTSSEPVSLTLPDSLQQVKLGITGSTFAVRDSISWTVTSKEGKTLGVLVSSESLGKKIEGYMGPVPVFILIGLDNKILKMTTGNNEDTPEYLEIAEEGLYSKWCGIDAKAAEKVKVDAVSGATYSSLGIIQNVWKALAAYNASKK